MPPRAVTARDRPLARLAPWTPIGFVPNGVDLASYDDLPSRTVLEEEYPELRGKFVLLFFARLHAKKGLDLLAEALRPGLPGPSGPPSPARRHRRGGLGVRSGRGWKPWGWIAG